MMKPGRIILILSLCGILAAWPGAGKAAAGQLPDFIPAALADLWNPVAQSEASPGDGTDSDSQGFLGRVRLLAGEVPNLLIVFIFLFFLCLLEGVVLVLWDSDRQHQRRLKKRLKYLDRLEKRFAQESLLKAEGLAGQTWLRQGLKKFRHLANLQNLLSQSDLNWPLGVFLLVLAGCGALGLSLGFYQRGPVGAAVGLALGLFLPYKTVVFKKNRRTKLFEKQLPEALDLLARSLKAGHAFAAGLQLVGEEMPSPLGMEFFKTFKEYNHGMDMNSALINMCSRVELKELRFFTTAVMIQRETGGNLTDILEKIAGLIRERFKLRNQIKALTAEGRLSGWILILMPPVLFLMMLKLNPDYTLMLVNHNLGRMMAMTAIFFQFLGMMTIRKIVNIKI